MDHAEAVWRDEEYWSPDAASHDRRRRVRIGELGYLEGTDGLVSAGASPISLSIHPRKRSSRWATQRFCKWPKSTRRAAANCDDDAMRARTILTAIQCRIRITALIDVHGMAQIGPLPFSLLLVLLIGVLEQGFSRLHNQHYSPHAADITHIFRQSLFGKHGLDQTLLSACAKSSTLSSTRDGLCRPHLLGSLFLLMQ